MPTRPKDPETDKIQHDLLQEALRESETKFSYIVEAAADAIITADAEGKIVSWNGMAGRMFGYKEKEAVGKPLTMIMPERYISGHHSGFVKFIKTGESRVIGKVYEVHGLRKDGSEFPCELSLASWELGKGRYFAGILRDITERKEAMERLKEANKNLKDAQVQLVQSEKMASLGMIVAGVAHEINTPMGAVKSMHDTLVRVVRKLKDALKEHDAEEFKENKNLLKLFKLMDDANDVINSGTERVINIVDRLRSFAHLDEAELKDSDIHDGIEDTLTLINRELEPNIKVIKKFGEIPLITCYPAQLNQVFLNMMMNASQAMPDKGTLTITTIMKNNKIYIEFQDTGIGIPKENLKKYLIRDLPPRA